jgi:long-chain acyl-CoA synthetase
MLFHRFALAVMFVTGVLVGFAPALRLAGSSLKALMNESGECPDFLHKCFSGGAPVAPSITERLQARFGTYIHNIYGLTESASPTHAVPLGAKAPVDPISGALSIGVPVQNCDAKIIGLEDPDKECRPAKRVSWR